MNILKHTSIVRILFLVIPFISLAQSQTPCEQQDNYFTQLENENPILSINLAEGWNMIGFPCSIEQDASTAFDLIQDQIALLKDNNGNVFMPEFGFNGIGNLIELNGYQISMTSLVEGFSFCESVIQPIIEGCTDCESLNFNPWATNNNGTCQYLGCMDPTAFNYNDIANIDDESCITVVLGCLDATACNYDTAANTSSEICIYTDGFCETCENGLVVDNDSDNDGLCDSEDILSGCIDETACNYDSSSTLNEDNTLCTYVDGLCETCEEGLVVDNDSDNDGLCDSEDILSGCIDETACNYDSTSTLNEDNNLCNYNEVNLPAPFTGYTGANMIVMLTPGFVISLTTTNENAYLVALNSDGLVIGSSTVYGVSQTTIPLWGNDSQTTVIDRALAGESISFQLINGTDLYDVVMPTAVSYTTNGLLVQMAPATLAAVDCSHSTALACPYDAYLEYSSTANDYNVSECLTLVVEGCKSTLYLECNPEANREDGSCLTLIIEGCIDVAYAEYNAEANTDDGSCSVLTVLGCNNPIAENYNAEVNTNDGTCTYTELIHGGIVFYIDESGEHGLVAAIEDLGQYEWGCYGTSISGADGQAIGTGYQNTLDIVAGCSDVNIAAFNALNSTTEGYTDWYLPSKDELLEMYNTIGLGGPEANIGGFENNFYWSSSEDNDYLAWGVDFGNGATHLEYKNNTYRVRVIRAFYLSTYLPIYLFIYLTLPRSGRFFFGNGKIGNRDMVKQ